MKKKRYFHIVGTGPKPGKEDEYNEWYDGHVKILFDFENLKRVTRTRMYIPWGPQGEVSPQYVTIYEFKNKEDFTDFCNSSVMKIADEDYDTKGKQVSEVYWAGAYESVTDMEK